MIFKQVNVSKDTQSLAKDLAKKYDVPMYLFLDTIVQFFDENKTIVNADFFTKSEKGKSKLSDKIGGDLKKMVSKETNRVIGFLKVQDKFMKAMKKDIIYSFSDGEIDNYHPLFMDYNYLIDTYKDILIDKNILNEADLYDYIMKNLGKDIFDNFIECEQRIKEKKIFLEL